MQLPVLVSDLDLECKLWIKLRLAPMTPYIGTIALAFVGPPNIKVQLLPYNHVRLMQIPILQVSLLVSGIQFLDSVTLESQATFPRACCISHSWLILCLASSLGAGLQSLGAGPVSDLNGEVSLLLLVER